MDHSQYVVAFYAFANNCRRRALCLRVVRLSVRWPLTPISRDAISLYLAERYKWNWPRVFMVWVGIIENDFNVTGQVKGHRCSEVKRSLRVTRYLNMSLLSGVISMKLATNNQNHHVSRNCKKCFQGHGSTIKVKCTFLAKGLRSTSRPLDSSPSVNIYTVFIRDATVLLIGVISIKFNT